MKHDVFRHVFVSMHLRRYLGRWMASYIMTQYEYRNPASNWELYPSRYMDFHNNAVGNYYMYGFFRGHWLWDRYDWNKWATNTYNYVESPAFSLNMNWTSSRNSRYTVLVDELNANNYKYIRY